MQAQKQPVLRHAHTSLDLDSTMLAGMHESPCLRLAVVQRHLLLLHCPPFASCAHTHLACQTVSERPTQQLQAVALCQRSPAFSGTACNSHAWATCQCPPILMQNHLHAAKANALNGCWLHRWSPICGKWLVQTDQGSFVADCS